MKTTTVETSALEGYQLSPQQSYLWKLMSAHGALDSRCSLILDIQGVIDASKLHDALREVVRGHEILRTRFERPETLDVPLQVIADTEWSWLAFHDLSDLAESDQTAKIAACLEELSANQNEANGEIFAAALYRLAPTQHLLWMSVSSLCADAPTLTLIASELAWNYDLHSGARARQLNAGNQSMQYADFSAWHLDLCQDMETEEQRAVWRPKLMPSLLKSIQSLTFDHSLSNNLSCLKKHELVLDENLMHRLSTLSAACKVSLSSLLLAGWSVLLWRLNNREPLSIGVASDARVMDELSGAMGPYTIHLPMSLKLFGDETLESVAGQVSAWMSDAAEHQEFYDPRCIPGSVENGENAIPYLFEYLQYPVLRTEGGLDITISALDAWVPPSELCLRCVKTPSGYINELQYNTSSFSVDDVVRLAGQFISLLQSVVANPGLDISRLTLLTENERQRLIVGNNETSAQYQMACIHQLIAEQAVRTPDNVAISSKGNNLSYAELDKKSNRLANWLISRGISTGARVAVCMDLCLDMPVTLLGIMKAGATYVPLDPSFPEGRLRLALDDAKPALVITHSGLLPNQLKQEFSCWYLDRDSSDIAQLSDMPPQVDMEMSDSVYVMFTSGSTGRPNGVVVTHRGLTNYLTWAQTAYRLKQGKGALLHSPISFDLSITALFGPLLAGQRVILVDRSDGVAGLANEIRMGDDFTLLKATPTHLRALSQLLPRTGIDGKIRTLVIGGEELPGDILSFWRQHMPTARIYNEYGPTETVVGCCVYEANNDLPVNVSVPIGRPIANTRIYVVDESFQPLPTGVAGELCIAGDGVAIGYLSRDELTRDKFVADPFGSSVNERMYRSGDLARFLPDGNLEFLGRIDEQVKIRGYRIEPGEVEHVLRQHPALIDAVVTARDDHRYGRYLIGYVVADTKDAIDPPEPDAIRSFVSKNLPAYMVPGQIVYLPSLPQTPSGKIDRRALPDPSQSSLLSHLTTQYVAPRTPNEEILAAIFASVFDLQRVGIDDNYFTLGGDSLRSVQVTSLARKRGVPITVPQLHTFPTVRSLAQNIALVTDSAVVNAVETSAFSLVSKEDRAIMPEDVVDAYPLNLLQEGMIYHRNFAPKSAVYHAICSYRIKAPFDIGLMRRSVERVVNRHPLLRTSFDLTSFSQALQIVHKNVHDPLQFEDLRGSTVEELDQAVDDWFEEEKARGFDLDEFPLIRYKVHQLADDVFQLTYSFHHEIIDGWSDAFMVTELLTEYFSALNGQELHIPEPSATFRDAIALEHAALQNNQYHDFWSKNLEGVSVMRLPRVAPLAADKGKRKIIKFEIPISKQLSDKVQNLALCLAVPIKTVCLAAHVKVMHMLAGQPDVITYTVSNGRPEHSDGFGVIGLFVNSLAFRMQLTGGTWADLITQTLDTEHKLLPYRRYPMAELKRQHGSEPLSETLFFFNHYHVTDALQRWENAELLDLKVYGESTFPYCVNAYMTPFEKKLGMRIEYDSLQYSKELMENMSGYYVAILEAMVSSPSARYESQCLLSKPEQEQLLRHYNDTVQVPSVNENILDLIEACAAKHPDELAVIDRHESLTYKTLNSRANQLARYLIDEGVGPEVQVGLCMPRSSEAIVVILAVLKAGGAYLPLDPTQPLDRIFDLLSDVGVRFLFTIPELDVQFSDRIQRVVSLSAISQEVEKRSGADFARRGTASNLAYVIHTSGSTGIPKGVAVTYDNLLNSTLARTKHYKNNPSRFLLLSPLAFDSSIAGIFWTLSTGGALVLPPDVLSLDLVELANFANQWDISHVLCVPSLYGTLLEQLTDSPPVHLQSVIVAGESCSKELFDCHSRTLPKVALHNEYGPTEATVWATVWDGIPLPSHTVPIGRPIGNTEIYLLDTYQQPVPKGVTGQIYIGGAGVVRGYINNSMQTAEKFCPDPFSGRQGSRLYKTGDLGRYTPDGQLEFMGRLDYQVKVQGFRVELGEIESVLDKHPGIQRSVVLSREYDGGVAGLVAYILPRRKHGLDVKGVQDYVRSKLPKYMIPSAVVFLDTVPLKATGKLDRDALPKPTDLPVTVYVAPRTQTEEVMAAIWAHVLGREKVGVFDNFFDLNGESLRALRIMSQIRKVFQIQLPIRVLFEEASTVAELSEVVDATRWANKENEEYEELDTVEVVEGEI